MTKLISSKFALFIAFFVGYISLSQEIVWMRIVSYANKGRSDSFAYALGFLLVGIGLGAILSRTLKVKWKIDSLPFIAYLIAISSVFFIFSIPICGWLSTFAGPIGRTSIYISIAIVSCLAGGVFPLICELSIKSSDKVGSRLSWIYFANIVGATIGPLITGFILLDVLSLHRIISLLSTAGIIMACIFYSMSFNKSRRGLVISAGVIIAGAFVFGAPYLYSNLYEKIHHRAAFDANEPYKYLIENKSGVIAVERLNDALYGGGAYDGNFNLDPVLNTNDIIAAYHVANIHPKPSRVLVIGLGSGSWTAVVASHEAVKKEIVVVEINPGYSQLIDNYQQIASILRDYQVKINIDDGRRWLNRHPDEKFDFILMNCTYHWRAYATNLLSKEFMQLCKRHLKEGGVCYFNHSLSRDVMFTAAHVFKYVNRIGWYMACSDSPFDMSKEERMKSLSSFRIGGKPVFDQSKPKYRKVFNKLLEKDLRDHSKEILEVKGLEIVTDDNMRSEYPNWYRPNQSWIKYFKGKATQ